MSQQLHLVYPSEIIPSLHDALENEGFSVCGVSNTLQQFIEELWDNKMDPGIIIIIGNTVGAIRKESLLIDLREIRRFLPKNRIIIQLQDDCQEDTILITQIVELEIYDVFFTTEFNIDDLQEWVRSEKDIEDYAHLADYPRLKAIHSKTGQGLLGKLFGRTPQHKSEAESKQCQQSFTREPARAEYQESQNQPTHSKLTKPKVVRKSIKSSSVNTTAPSSKSDMHGLGPSYRPLETNVDIGKDQLPLDQTVVIKERIVGMVKIGVSGITQRIGATHQAIQLSLYLADHGFKVACVEMHRENKNSAFLSFKTESNTRIHRGFTYKKVDFYPELTLEEYVRVTAASYDYVVVDYGEITSNLQQGEFVRCDLQILTMGASLWDFQYFYGAWKIFSDWEYRKPWFVLVNFADDQMFKDIIWSFSRRDQSQLKLNFIQNTYHPNPLELADDVYALEKVLSSVLPKQETKRWFSFNR